MSYKNNRDLRSRDAGGWFWLENELLTVFAPLIGPQACMVYVGVTRLMNLIQIDPQRYSISVRNVAHQSAVGKSKAAALLNMLCDLGMVIRTRYLDGRPDTYELPSLRELAKVGEDELKRRIGVHHMDTAPFDQRSKTEEERSRRLQKRTQSGASGASANEQPLFEGTGSSVHQVDTATGQPQIAPTGHFGVHGMDTVSTDGSIGVHGVDTLIKEESSSKNKNPLPPAEQGEVGPEELDGARPVLPVPAAMPSEPGFAESLPVAVQWVAARLGLSKRRMEQLIGEQLTLWCKTQRRQLEDAAVMMANSGQLLHEHAHLLRHRPWGWRRYIGEGHWTRPLPYEPGMKPRDTPPPQEQPRHMPEVRQTGTAEGDSLWRRMQAQLAVTVIVQSYRTWLAPLRGDHVDEHRVLIVRVPSHQFLHVGERYADEIEAALAKVDASLTGARFEVAGSGPPD